MQAALALSPRDAVNVAYGSSSVTSEALQYREWANAALTVAVFEILVAGTIGTLLIRLFAPQLLARVSQPVLLDALRAQARHAGWANAFTDSIVTGFQLKMS